MDCLSLKIENETTNSSFNIEEIKQFLTLMEAKFQQYSDFRYQASGLFSLVLLAKKNQHEDVALKVIECHDHTRSMIEGMKRAHAIQKLLPLSHYMLEIYDQFFLSENEDRLEQSSDSSLTSKRYFVQEMQLCHGSLSGLLESFRQEKNDPSENLKETLAIQMLDAVNLLHSKQMAHRNIKPESFLISYDQDNSPIIKLRNLGLSSPNSSQNSTHSLPPNRQPETEMLSIEQDLFFLGLVFLQLDNVQTTFDYQLPPIQTIQELAGFQEGQIFPNRQLNRSSLLYEVACKILSKSDKNRESTSSLLLFLFNKSSEASQRTPLFSVVCSNSIDTICWSTPQMKLDHLKVLRKGAKPAQLNELIKEFEVNAREQKERYLTADQLKNALRIMLDWKEFKEGYDVLGVGESGVYLGVENLKEQRKSVLKLSLCSNQAQVDEEIEIMRICQTSPYIMKFYDCKYFEDTDHNRFVVYEIERCKYSLKYLLQLQDIYKTYTNEQKQIIMLQIIDPILFLHKNKILHRNITLDSFLITFNENEQILVKLCNLHYSSKLLDTFVQDSTLSDQVIYQQYNSQINCLVERYLGENPLYFAPERWGSPHPTTNQTNWFAVGLCLLMLDNYLVFSEEKLAEHFTFFLEPFDGIGLDQKFQINIKSNIFKNTQSFLNYSPKQRNPYIKIVDLILQCRTLQKHSFNTVKCPLVPLHMNSNYLQGSLKYLRRISLNLQGLQIQSDYAQEVLLPLADMVNLTSLSLNFEENNITNIGEKSFLQPLSGILGLTKLAINLRENSISDFGALNLLSPLSDLLNLQSLSLNFSYNQLTKEGANYLFFPLSKLTNLSWLAINLKRNSIGDIGTQYLFYLISNLLNLKTLHLELNDCSIGDAGIQALSYPLTSLFNLEVLSVEVLSNKMYKKSFHIFKNLFKSLKYFRFSD